MIASIEPEVDERGIRKQIIALLPRLRRFAFSLTTSEEDADDLLQSALERALGRLHQWRPGTRLDSWLYRIIHTQRIDQTRHGRARAIHVPFVADSATVADAPERIESSLMLESVLRAMGRLSDTDRAMLTMVCMDGMSYAEAAESLEIPLGTVMSRLARARQRLCREVESGDGGSARVRSETR